MDSTRIDTLRRATVYSSDGDKIGKVEEVYLGDTSDEPEWVTVKTGLFGTSETFVPLADASVDGEQIRVPYSKDQVKDAPRTDADGQISEAEEDRLFQHYGVTSSTTAQTDTPAAAGSAGPAGTADTSGAGYTDGTGQDRRDYEGLDELGAQSGAAGVAGGTAGAGSTPGTASTPGTTGVGYAENTADSRRDRAGEAGIEGRDTSGPTTDEAMTRSEERLQVGTQRREAGRARLRKHIVTETQTAQVPTSHEELTIEREPITEANRGAAQAGAQLSEEEHEVVLHEEVPVVSKTVEAVERVKLGTETQHDTQTVAADVRKEQIDLDRDGVRDGAAGRAGGSAGDDVFDADADSARAASERDDRI